MGTQTVGPPAEYIDELHGTPEGTASVSSPCFDTDREGFVRCMQAKGVSLCDALAIYLNRYGFQNQDDELVTRTFCSTVKGFEWTYKEGVPIALTIYAGGGSARAIYFAYKTGGKVPALITAADEALGHTICVNPSSVIKPKVYNRPSGFRKQTIEDSYSALPDSPSGTKQCPGCSTEITGKKYPVVGKDRKVRMVRDYDIDHINIIWADRVKQLKARGATRAEVIEEYNRMVRALCPSCNRSHRLEPPRLEEFN